MSFQTTSENNSKLKNNYVKIQILYNQSKEKERNKVSEVRPNRRIGNVILTIVNSIMSPVKIKTSFTFYFLRDVFIFILV